MGRGKDKVIKSTDFPNMSPREQSMVNILIANRGVIPGVRARGTAAVRSRETGNTRYGVGATPGNYNED